MTNFTKILFDKLLAILLISIFLPILLIISLINYIMLGSIFFVQERPGKDGKLFNLIKFRSMSDERDETGILLDDSMRLTKFGSFLRSTSLDELPEIINILRGEMSFVGPRPLLVEYLALYSEEQAKRHSVRPGITGWAQINGRNSLSWEEKFDLDIWYVQNLRLSLDIKILFVTIFKVLKREGISADGEATMSKFKGNLNQQRHE
jgi:lipopolysaccharide/colanic/teichoic acid biosynthesis glycosyltransferase